MTRAALLRPERALRRNLQPESRALVSRRRERARRPRASKILFIHRPVLAVRPVRVELRVRGGDEIRSTEFLTVQGRREGGRRRRAARRVDAVSTRARGGIDSRAVRVERRRAIVRAGAKCETVTLVVDVGAVVGAVVARVVEDDVVVIVARRGFLIVVDVERAERAG